MASLIVQVSLFVYVCSGLNFPTQLRLRTRKWKNIATLWSIKFKIWHTKSIDSIVIFAVKFIGLYKMEEGYGAADKDENYDVI